MPNPAQSRDGNVGQNGWSAVLQGVLFLDHLHAARCTTMDLRDRYEFYMPYEFDQLKTDMYF